MKNQQPNPILSKEGKTIFDEAAFLAAFCARLRSKKIYLRQPLRDALLMSIQGQARLGQVLVTQLKKLEGKPYNKTYLHSPWPFSKPYALILNLFLHHPAFAEPFIDTVNQYYYYPVLQSWRETQSISYFPKSSDYFARSLPGTSKMAGGRAQDCADILLSNAKRNIPSFLQEKAQSSYSRMFGKRWAAFKGCLLPNGYLPGSAMYGRLKSVPPSTLANSNKKLKLAILGCLKATQGISFFELDMASCHAKIFEDLFDWRNFERSDLPPLDNLWPSMIDDFWSKVPAIDGFDDIKARVAQWSNSDLKGLLKNQYYKSLNGGMANFVEDNIERSKLKLGISSEEQNDYCSFFHQIFSEMKVFILQTAFIEQINDGTYLYLPNHVKGYSTNTPSKVQLRKMANPDYIPKSLTGNSRLFSNVELCLILHVFCAIVSAKVDWLVIAYESDGLLIAALGDLDKVTAELLAVNSCFQERITHLTGALHKLELKNFV